MHLFFQLSLHNFFSSNMTGFPQCMPAPPPGALNSHLEVESPGPSLPCLRAPALTRCSDHHSMPPHHTSASDTPTALLFAKPHQ